MQRRQYLRSQKNITIYIKYVHKIQVTMYYVQEKTAEQNLPLSKCHSNIIILLQTLVRTTTVINAKRFTAQRFSSMTVHL